MIRGGIARWLVPALFLAAGAARGASDPDAGFGFAGEAVVRPPVQLQDSVRLTRLTSAVVPADGLLSLGLGTRGATTVYPDEKQLEIVSRRDFFARFEVTPRPWLAVWAELPWHTWSDGVGEIPVSGSGLGDGVWQGVLALPIPGDRLHLSVLGGGNLVTGRKDEGLGEGVFSPRAGGAMSLRVMAGSTTPEMRLHLNVLRSWNRSEESGYGMGLNGFQPWPPRYPSAEQAGGNRGNDAVVLGAAVEMRRGTTSLWVEYGLERFDDDGFAVPSEQQRHVGAGLRWGVVEGLALHGDFTVNLALDDTNTSWYPAFPDWSMSVAVTRQFSIGGKDRDGDGIVDRKDACPTVPEDLDGFEDDDGCPDRDNDGDGIPDYRDVAPDLAEDFDGFQDEDGIPEPDNDLDGVPDRDDLCPNEPEDYDGHQDDDGCPDDFLDRDHDGVEDRKDACPDDAEDLDGFEDDDGCPEPDNDLDGIPDDRDQCPDQPEDYNGQADEDGCPEDS